MIPHYKNRNTHENDSTQNNEWISLSVAAQGVPYSAEYLSLLARKKLLPAKKIRGVWYTTLPIVKEYMRRQMSRTLREPFASVGNSSKDGPCFARPVLASEFSTAIPPEKAGEINESIFLENIVSQVGEEAAPPLPKDLSAEPAFSIIPSSRAFHPHLQKEHSLADDAIGFAEGVVSAVEEETSKKKTWAETPFTEDTGIVRDDGILKITEDEKVQSSPEDAYARILFQKFLTSFTAYLDKEIESHEGFLVRTWHTIRGAYSAVLSHKKLFSLFLIFLLLFTALPFRVVSAFFDKAYRGVVEAVNDANTVLGFRPGTSANEILLLDQEGKVAIFGNVETEGQFKSFAENGVAPIYVKSMTKVENLNADYLDNLSAEEFTLAFVTKNGNTTYDNVFLEGKVAVGQTLLVRGAANLLSSLSVDGELSVFGDTKLHKNLTVDGSSYFKALISAQDIAARHIYADRVNATEVVADGVLSVHGNANVDGQIVVQGFGLFQGGVSGDTGTFRRSVSTGGNLSARGDVELGGTGSEIILTSDLWSIDTEGNAIFSGDATIKDSLSVSATTSVNRLRASNIGIGTTTPGYEIGVVGSGLFEGIVIAYEGFVGNAITATSTLSAEGLATFLSGFISSASSTISSTLHVLDALVASSSLVVDGLAELYGGFISSASSTIAAPLHVSDTISASSTLTVGGLATFDSGFISSASSSATILSASDSLYASSSIAVDGMSLFALTGGSVGIGTTSPGTLLAVQGDAFINDNLTVGGAFSATSTLRVDDLSTLNGFISSASSTVGGPFYVQDHLSASSTLTLAGLGTFEGGGILGGASSTVSGTLSLSNNVIANGGGIDIGDAGTRFGIFYADEVNATLLVGTIDGGNVNAETLTINANAGDNEDAFLAFERGTETPNAFLKWDGSTNNDNFIFNFGVVTQASSTVSGPFHVSDHLSASSTLTLAGLGIFDSGFISSASSTIAAPLHVSDVITSSSSIAVDGTSLFALTGGNVGIGTAGPKDKLEVYEFTALPDAANSEDVIAWFTGNSGDGNNHGLRISQRRLVVDDGVNTVNTAGIRFAWAPDPQAANANDGRTWFEMGNDNAGALSNQVFRWGIDAQTGFDGTEWMRIDGGNVGIGTTNPQALLDVLGAASSTSLRIDGASSDAPITFATNLAGQAAVHSWTMGIDQSDGGKFKIASSTALGTSDRFVIDGAGIGYFTQGLISQASSSISSTLHVSDTLSASSTLNVGGLSIFESGIIAQASSTVSGPFHISDHLSASSTLTVASLATFDSGFISSASSTVSAPFHVSDVITSSSTIAVDGTSLFALTGGSVGIGTVSPFTKLHIATSTLPTDDGSNTIPLIVLQSESAGDGQVARIGWQPYSGANLASIDFVTNSLSNFNSEIAFRTSNNVTVSERMRIDASGNVGIGTTNPQALLDVLGAASSTSLRIDGASGDAPITFATNLAGQAAVHSWTMGADQSDGGKFKIASSTALGTDDRFVIDGNGNVGIGTAGPTAKFEVDGFGDVISSVNNISQVARFGKAGGVTNMGIVFDTDAEAGAAALRGFNISHASQDFHIVKYDSTGVASPTFDFTVGASGKVAVGDDSPDFVFEIASSTTSYDYFGVSGASDGSIFTITNTGNVGIGTTSPISKLSIEDLDDGVTDHLAIVIANSDVAGGIELETPSATAFGEGILNIGLNTNRGIVERGDEPIAAWFRVDTRAANSRFSWNWEQAGGDNPKELMSLSNSGNLGIGDTSPDFMFEISTTTAPNYFGISNAADGDIFVVNSSGNVGIGTTSPSAALSVTGTGEYVMYVNDETTDASPFVIDGSGNVGIGKSNPTRNLEIEGTDGIEIAITTTDAQTNSVAQLLAFSDNTNLSLNSHSSGRTLSRFGITLGGWGELLGANNTGSTNGLIIGVSPAKPLVFGTNNLERMRIDENGNIGIGTTTPNEKLSVVGGFTHLGYNSTSIPVSDPVNGGLTVGWNRSNGNAEVNLYNVFNNATNAFQFSQKTGASTYTDLMTITGSGNVGIGTNAPAASLQVVGATTTISSSINRGLISEDTIYGELRIGANLDGSQGVGIRGVQVPGFSDSMRMDFTTPTAGGAETHTVRMSIDNNGNVGIGRSPSTELLEVAGRMAFTSDTTTSATSLCVANSTLNTIMICSSLAEYKKDIATLSLGLETVLALRPVEFDWRSNDKHDLGFIAEEVEAANPLLAEYGLTEEGEQKLMGVKYNRLTSLLTKAIQEIGWRVDVVNAPTTTPSLAIDEQGFVSVAKDFIAGRTLYVRDDTGFVGIGTSTPEYALHVAGDVAANSFINVSARDTKTRITRIDDSNNANCENRKDGPCGELSTGFVDKIKNLPIFTYRYTYEADDAPLRMGLIAEESPVEVLSADKKGVDLYKLITFVTGGMKELIQSVERLALRVEDLSTRITRIENANNANCENLKDGPCGELSTPAVENSGARTGLAEQGPSLLEFPTAVLASLADFGMTIVDGVVNFTQLVVDNLLVQKLVVENMTANALTLGNASNRAGITMYDKNTGEPFCLSVINGNVATESGACGAVENSTARTGLAPQSPSLLELSTATTTTETITEETATTTSSFQFLDSITNSDNANATTTEETTTSSAQNPDSSTQSATTTEETSAVENSTASADLAPQGQTLLEFPTAEETTTETPPIEEATTDAPTS